MSPQGAKKGARHRGLIVVAAGALGLVLVATAVTVATRTASADRSGPAADRFRGSEPPVRFTLPRFQLTSYSGKAVSSGELQGKVVLLTILDAQCTDVCPILASVVAGAIDRLTPGERGQVRAIGISGDPAEDTPRAVRQFLAKRRAVSRLDYLLGSERELRPVWRELQILPSLDSGSDSMHSAPLRIYGRNGVWLATQHAGVDLSEENLLHDVRVALAENVR